VAFSDDYDWVELTPEMKEAAVAIGFNEELWCAGSCDVVTADLTEVPSVAPSATVSLSLLYQSITNFVESVLLINTFSYSPRQGCPRRVALLFFQLNLPR
jgi:hypothetical protein